MSLADTDRSVVHAGVQPDRPDGESAAAAAALTDELVQQVADRVYAMLMAEIANERERRCPLSTLIGQAGG